MSLMVQHGEAIYILFFLIFIFAQKLYILKVLVHF